MADGSEMNARQLSFSFFCAAKSSRRRGSLLFFAFSFFTPFISFERRRRSSSLCSSLASDCHPRTGAGETPKVTNIKPCSVAPPLRRVWTATRASRQSSLSSMVQGWWRHLARTWPATRMSASPLLIHLLPLWIPKHNVALCPHERTTDISQLADRRPSEARQRTGMRVWTHLDGRAGRRRTLLNHFLLALLFCPFASQAVSLL